MADLICIAAVVWTICGALAYAITFAHLQKSFPTIAKEQYRQDLSFAVFVAITGPLGLLSSFLLCGFAEHGLKWR